MDPTAAIGTLFQTGDGATPEVFATVAKVLDIGGPELSADTDDITNQESTGDFEEVLPTILRTGQVTFDLLFMPTDPTHDTSTGLLADYVNKTLRNARIVWPDSADSTWQFSGYVTKFAPSAPVGGALRASVGFKLTGQPTFGAGS